MTAQPEPSYGLGAGDKGLVDLMEALEASLAAARREGARREAVMRLQFDRDADAWDKAVPLEQVEARIRKKFDRSH